MKQVGVDRDCMEFTARSRAAKEQYIKEAAAIRRGETIKQILRWLKFWRAK